jgi:hypothetical protein
MEGSRPGSIPLTNGSGSGHPCHCLHYMFPLKIFESFKSHAAALSRTGTLKNLPFYLARNWIREGLRGRIRILYEALRIHTTVH